MNHETIRAQHLATLRAEYEETGDPFTLIDALLFCGGEANRFYGLQEMTSEEKEQIKRTRQRRPEELPDHYIPIPRWSFDALLDLVVASTRSADGRGRRTKQSKLRGLVDDLKRHALVQQIIDGGGKTGPSRDGTKNCFEEAATLLAEAGAAVGADAVRESYYRVRKNPQRHYDQLPWFIVSFLLDQPPAPHSRKSETK